MLELGAAAPDASHQPAPRATTSSRSGALSWTKSTSGTASSTSSTTVRLPGSGSGAIVSRLQDGRAFASISPTLRSASGSGSWSRTSIPDSRKRAAQPPPITPAPSKPTRPTVATRSGTTHQVEPVAYLLGAEHPHVHRVQKRHRPFDQLAVGREHATAEVEIVLQPDPDIAAHEHRERGERDLHPPDRKRREDGVGRQPVDHRKQGARIVRSPVRNTRAELDHGRI